ncbi:MAG: SMC-Scp complex subunit ScpB [Defluviitaleaceae bacterium]|nr:SMC-Scp complex subunit ScpB [Defluviitaleaceae bacterium]
MDHDHYLGILEGLLFAVGEEGVSFKQLADVLDLGNYEIEVLISQLRKRYKNEKFGLAISEMAGVYKMVTKKDHAPYFKKLLESPHQKTLSSAALEVLAIIAYKQPITRGELEAIRGVSNDAMMKKLLMFDLIEEAGRATTPGRPMQFKTTDAFLDYFGIKTLEELPEINEAAILSTQREEVTLFT